MSISQTAKEIYALKASDLNREAGAVALGAINNAIAAIQTMYRDVFQQETVIQKIQAAREIDRNVNLEDIQHQVRSLSGTLGAFTRKGMTESSSVITDKKGQTKKRADIERELEAKKVEYQKNKSGHAALTEAFNDIIQDYSVIQEAMLVGMEAIETARNAYMKEIKYQLALRVGSTGEQIWEGSFSLSDLTKMGVVNLTTNNVTSLTNFGKIQMDFSNSKFLDSSVLSAMGFTQINMTTESMTAFVKSKMGEAWNFSDNSTPNFGWIYQWYRQILANESLGENKNALIQENAGWVAEPDTHTAGEYDEQNKTISIAANRAKYMMTVQMSTLNSILQGLLAYRQKLASDLGKPVSTSMFNIPNDIEEIIKALSIPEIENS